MISNHDVTTTTATTTTNPWLNISMNNACVLALHRSQRVAGFGSNMYGELGLGDVKMQDTPKWLSVRDDIIQIAQDDFSTYFLHRNGTVSACGSKAFSLLELDSTPAQIPGLENVKKIITSINGMFFLCENGSVYACGHNRHYAQLGLDERKNYYLPTHIKVLDGIEIKDICCEINSTYFLAKNNTVYWCGTLSFAQFLGDDTAQMLPAKIDNLENVKQVAAGFGSVFFLLNTGKVLQWDYLHQQPTLIANLENISVEKIFVGTGRTWGVFFLTTEGDVYSYWNNHNGQLRFSYTANKEPTKTPSVSNVKEIVSTNDATFFNLNDGSVLSCGWNKFCSLGHGDRGKYNSLAPIANLDNVEKIYAGEFLTFFVKTNGDVFYCGSPAQLVLRNTNGSVPSSLGGVSIDTPSLFQGLSNLGKNGIYTNGSSALFTTATGSNSKADEAHSPSAERKFE